MRIKLTPISLAIAVLLTMCSATQAATILVTNAADSGPGSLRAALASAANGDTIDAKGMSGTILLTSGELLVSRNVRIVGSGPGNLAVDGNGDTRVFHINTNAVVTITSLTITNGFANGDYPVWFGGGILNDHATLTVSNCTVSGGSAVFGGGIYSDAAQGSARLTVIDSTLSGNSAAGQGGGIYNNRGVVTVVRSVLTHNVGTYSGGGAILNDGYRGSATLQIVDSTLNDNSSQFDSGGAIYNNGVSGRASLQISNSYLYGNYASVGGAVINDGDGGSATLRIFNSSVSNNRGGQGGGINNTAHFGTAMTEIVDSTLSDNSATSGGVIFNAGGFDGTTTVQIVRSTLSGNVAYAGGSMYILGGNIAVRESTLSGNSTLGEDGLGGAIFNAAFPEGPAHVQIFATTFSSNSGHGGFSIFNEGRYGATSLEIGNTILGEGASGGTVTNLSGRVTSLGYNLSSDNGGGVLTNTTDLIYTDPRLGPLQDNGGPTFTHALLGCSPAIDKGKNFSSSPTDQRGPGFVRTFDNAGVVNAAGGDGTDIGAFEHQPSPNGFTVLNTDDSGPGSLRQAILDANARPGPDLIDFAPCVYGTVLLTSGELLISSDLTIHGPGATNLAVNGNGASRILHIAPSNTVTIAGLAIINGLHAAPFPLSRGGGIYNDQATLTVSNAVLSYNRATFGAGIYNKGGSGAGASLKVVNCTLTGNWSRDAASAGGGIYNDGSGGTATAQIVSCTLKSNSVDFIGGAIRNFASGGSASMEILNSTLNGNSAHSGGGVQNDSFSGGITSLEIGNCTLSGNSAVGGGGIYNSASSGSSAHSKILNCTLSGNKASGDGSSIYNAGSGASVQLGSTILNGAAFDPPYDVNIFNFNNLGTITSLGYNLSSDNGSGFLLTATGDQVNTDPRLGPLQDNGGPTFTHALLCGSPAIDRGKNFSASATDQRGPGFARIFDDPPTPEATGGDGTDIGAFEAQASFADSLPPSITCPSDLAVESTGETGAVVTYSVAAADACDPNPVVTCVPPPGSTFPIGDTLVQCTARDASGNAAPCSFTVTVLGARGASENLLAELIALRATVTDEQDGHKLDEAIEHLTKSLDSDLWVDQTHLERKHGEKVFHEDKEAVKKLCELIKGNQSHIPDLVLQGFIDRIFRADRLLASVAIQEAIAAGASSKKIEQAQKHLAKGDVRAGDDKCDNGIDDYRNAWEHAARAKISPSHLANGRLRLEILGEPGDQLAVQASSNLVDWVTIGTGKVNADGVVMFEDADAGRHPARYYRAVSK